MVNETNNSLVSFGDIMN